MVTICDRIIVGMFVEDQQHIRMQVSSAVEQALLQPSFCLLSRTVSLGLWLASDVLLLVVQQRGCDV